MQRRQPSPSEQLPSHAQWRRCWRQRVSVSLAMGTLSMLYVFEFLGPTATLGFDISPNERQILIGVAAIFITGNYVLARRRSMRLHEEVTNWLDEGRPPTPEDAVALTQLPRIHSRAIATEWSVAIVVFTAIHLNFTTDAVQIAVLVLCGALFGAHMAWWVFLLIEKELGQDRDRLHELGVRLELDGRLGRRLGWTLALAGSILLLGAIMLAVWADRGSATDWARVVGPLAVFAALEGAAIVALFVRSGSESLQRLRAGLASVSAGDFTVRVPLDDPTEIGRLQQGFAEMVDGLRDREKLERLLAAHVGPGVAQASRRDGIHLTGVRREVSVLFVDMLDSTSLIARHSPEQMIGVINQLFEVVVSEVTSAGGEVLQFQGDGAICTFGAPVDNPNHGAAALKCARDLERAVNELHLMCVDVPMNVQVAMGVSTGPVVVGHLGTPERASYSVIGDAANEANRLVEKAKEMRRCTLVSGGAVAAAGDEAKHWSQLGLTRLRGLERSTELWIPSLDPVHA